VDFRKEILYPKFRVLQSAPPGRERERECASAADADWWDPPVRRSGGGGQLGGAGLNGPKTVFLFS
jgi:hypothetical protein